MLIIADSSPINVPVRIGSIDVLPALFSQVLIPTEVANELSHPKTPEVGKDFIAKPPPWLDVQRPGHVEDIPGIDIGEQAAISLAQELKADLLLIDDWPSRQAAIERRLKIIGTIGVLEAAARRGLVDLRQTFDRIRRTDFRVSENLLDDALRQDAERRRHGSDDSRRP
jgi:predicted nucleic acid-binding protein